VTQHDDREGRQHAVVDVAQELLQISTSTGYDSFASALRGESHSIAAISLLGTNADARIAASVASADQ
jgi:hypothetical protein